MRRLAAVLVGIAWDRTVGAGRRRTYRWHQSKVAAPRLYLGDGTALLNCSIENTAVIVVGNGIRVEGCLFIEDPPGTRSAPRPYLGRIEIR